MMSAYIGQNVYLILSSSAVCVGYIHHFNCTIGWFHFNGYWYKIMSAVIATLQISIQPVCYIFLHGGEVARTLSSKNGYDHARSHN